MRWQDAVRTGGVFASPVLAVAGREQRRVRSRGHRGHGKRRPHSRPASRAMPAAGERWRGTGAAPLQPRPPSPTAGRPSRRAGGGLSPCAQQILFGLPAFRSLGAADRHRALGFFREVTLARGETIYEAGDDADALYVVASGAVDVIAGTRSIARLTAGEVFGEAALVPGEHRSVTTRVALDAVLLVLPREALRRLLDLHPSLQRRVSVVLG